jgi:hypothetical protein
VTRLAEGGISVVSAAAAAQEAAQEAEPEERPSRGRPRLEAETLPSLPKKKEEQPKQLVWAVLQVTGRSTNEDGRSVILQIYTKDPVDR